MQNQKIHRGGHDGYRYFWNIKTDLTAGVYRSRCATASAVRQTLSRLGHTVKSVSPVTA